MDTLLHQKYNLQSLKLLLDFAFFETELFQKKLDMSLSYMQTDESEKFNNTEDIIQKLLHVMQYQISNLKKIDLEIVISWETHRKDINDVWPVIQLRVQCYETEMRVWIHNSREIKEHNFLFESHNILEPSDCLNFLKAFRKQVNLELEEINE